MSKQSERPLKRHVMRIWCCGCGDDVDARLTDGGEVYPHRADLKALPFWKCDACGNTVGCHHKTKNRTQPLGCLPTPELRRARQQIHALLDPIWRSGRMPRREIYKRIGDEIGRKYHTAQIRSIEEAQQVYAVVQRYA